MSQYISYDLKFGHFLPCPITAGDKTFFINLEIKKNDNAWNHRQLQYVYQFQVLYLLFTIFLLLSYKYSIIFFLLYYKNNHLDTTSKMWESYIKYSSYINLQTSHINIWIEIFLRFMFCIVYNIVYYEKKELQQCFLAWHLCTVLRRSLC